MTTAIEWTDVTWKAVPGWPCRVSSEGQLIGPSGKVLKPTVDPAGYRSVMIRRKKLRVHHAVLMAFVGPCPIGMECRHLDDDPGNNHVRNLAWGTRWQNMDDQVRLGTRRHGEDKPGCRLTIEEVEAIRCDSRPSRVVGEQYGVSHTAILRIRRGERWAAA